MTKNRRTASAYWKSGAKGGTNSVSTESGALNDADFSLGVLRKEGAHTDPGELIAGALVSSFSLALAKELQTSREVVGSIATTATVNLENLAAGWTITDIHLNVDANLPKLTQGQFIDATVQAKTACMVCRLLHVNITMNAKLGR